MPLFHLPAAASRAAVLGFMAAALGATGYVAYQHVVLQQPMRLKLGADGLWRWMTREEYLQLRLERAKAAVAANPDSYSAKYLVVALAVALEKEAAQRRAAESEADAAGRKRLVDGDITL